MIREYIDKIEFEESFYSQEQQAFTMYFVAPLAILKGKYPDAISAEIMVEFEAEDNRYFRPKTGRVEISPTGEHGDGLLDYDWQYVYVPYEEIELLLQVYDKWCDEHCYNILYPHDTKRGKEAADEN